MTQKELMLSGELYNASSDDSLYPDYVKARNILSKLNTMPFDDLSRKELINNLFGKIGKDCAIITPVYCDYGSNVYIGDRFFANYDCIFLDVCPITFGNDVFVHDIDKQKESKWLLTQAALIEMYARLSVFE